MKTFSFACFVITVLAAGALGCGSKEAPAAGGTTGAATAAASGAASAAPAAGGDKAAVFGSCVDKSAGVYSCKEYFGFLPMLAEDMCKGMSGAGVLTKGNVPCTRDKLVGTCEIKGEEGGERIFYYQQDGVTADMNKQVCELIGKWTPAAKGAASAAPAASGAPAAEAPAKAPAAPAKAPAAPAKAPAGKKKK